MKIAIFIDGPNIYGMTNNHNGIGRNIDFKAFLKHIKGMTKGQGHIVLQKVFFDVLPFHQKNNTFIYNLEKLGFESVPVPLKTYSANTSRQNNKTYKSRTDQMITIHLMKHLYSDHEDKFDRLILIAGDSDYQFVIEECQRNGIFVEVWATRKTLSSDLFKIANKINLFEDNEFLLLKTKMQKSKVVDL